MLFKMFNRSTSVETRSIPKSNPIKNDHQLERNALNVVKCNLLKGYYGNKHQKVIYCIFKLLNSCTTSKNVEVRK